MEYDTGGEEDIEVGYKLLVRSINNIKHLLSKYKYWSLLITEGLVDYTITNSDFDEEYLEMVSEYEEYSKDHGGVIFQNK